MTPPDPRDPRQHQNPSDHHSAEAPLPGPTSPVVPGHDNVLAIDGLALHEQVEAYRQVHEQLQQALSSIDSV